MGEKTAEKHVIVDYSYGDVSVYAATVKNARYLLDCSIGNLDPQVLTLARSSTTREAVTKEAILALVNNVLKLEVGKPYSKKNPDKLVTNELKQEIVMYCFKHSISVKPEINSYEFFKEFKIKDLAFVAQEFPSSAVIVEKYIKDQAYALNVIENDLFKPGASELAKVRYILEFAGELVDSSDIRYFVTTLKE